MEESKNFQTWFPAKNIVGWSKFGESGGKIINGSSVVNGKAGIVSIQKSKIRITEKINKNYLEQLDKYDPKQMYQKEYQLVFLIVEDLHYFSKNNIQNVRKGGKRNDEFK